MYIDIFVQCFVTLYHMAHTNIHVGDNGNRRPSNNCQIHCSDGWDHQSRYVQKYSSIVKLYSALVTPRNLDTR